MTAQVQDERHGRTTWGGERRNPGPRFSPAAGLLGGLLLLALSFSVTGQALADQPGRGQSSPGLWAVISAQTQEAVTQSRRFLTDLRLLYQISQLGPLATEPIVSPAVAPAAPAEPECKLISTPQHTTVMVKIEKAQS